MNVDITSHFSLRNEFNMAAVKAMQRLDVSRIYNDKFMAVLMVS